MFKIVYICRMLLQLTIFIRSCIYSQKDRYKYIMVLHYLVHDKLYINTAVLYTTHSQEM